MPVACVALGCCTAPGPAALGAFQTVGRLRRAAGLIGAPVPEAVPGFAAQVLAIVPENPVAAAAQGQIFPLVVFGLALGIAIARLPRDGAVEQGPIMLVLFQLAQAMLKIVDWMLVAAPVGIFGLV